MYDLQHLWLIALNVSGALSLFASAMAFAVGPVVSAVALDWYPERTPTRINRYIGYLFGLKSYQDVLNVYMGGTYEEIRKRTDNTAPARGVIWAALGTALIVTGLFL